jgi:hypothetical protein
MYLLVFIHVGRVAQQARNVCMEFTEGKQTPTDLIHDADTKFTKQFDEIFKAEGIRVKRLLPRCTNMAAYVERVIQTIQQECLDHFVVLGEKHLNHVVSEFVKYYHEERPHQGIGNVPVSGMAEHKGGGGEIVCRERLGGLLKHYERRGVNWIGTLVHLLLRLKAARLWATCDEILRLPFVGGQYALAAIDKTAFSTSIC